jgi:hypothetical protein
MKIYEEYRHKQNLLLLWDSHRNLQCGILLAEAFCSFSFRASELKIDVHNKQYDMNPKSNLNNTTNVSIFIIFTICIIICFIDMYFTVIIYSRYFIVNQNVNDDDYQIYNIFV